MFVNSFSVSFLILVLQLVCLAGWSSMLYAADKNGVSPNTISLPSGPGSIEGLGESFQPMLNTGSARHAVKISMPAGVTGNTPALSLSYESGRGDGPASIGWRYGSGSISRRTDKGIPRYVDVANNQDDDHDNQIDEPDELDTFVGPDGEELIAFANNIYRARIEGNFARYRRVGQGWEVDLKSGTTLNYGSSSASRITNASGTQAFRWLLAKSTDSNGNVIEYDYTSFSGSTNQKYLKQISYGPGATPWNVFYFASFDYEDKPDWRKDYRSGFMLKTSKRLSGIKIGIQGAQPAQCAPGDWNGDETPDALISRYALQYDDTSSHISHLTKVTRFGADGINYLPPTSFGYSAYTPLSNISAQASTFTSENAPTTVMDSELVDLIDLNRDGLPDILKTDRFGGNHIVYRNLGTAPQGQSRVVTWAEPAEVASEDGLANLLHLAKDQVSLADMNGDGISDLVHTTLSQEVSFFSNKGDFGWGAKQSMNIKDSAPPPPFGFVSVRSTDLDFNKQMDVVKSTDNGYTVWYNYRDGSYSREVHTAGARSGGRVMLFSDTGFDFADLNGDRLNDAARITPTHVSYAASMGHGNFADAVELAIPDTVLTDGENGQVRRAKLTDVNGDGLDDLVLERAAANQLWFWLNLGTDTFSTKYTVNDMPSQFSANTAIRWADLNGNGTTDLIYADSTIEPRLRMFDIGEASGGSAYPHLLNRIDNGLGVVTHINYQSSTEHYLAAASAGQPWTSSVPFPLQVVTEVTTTTGLDLDQLPGLDEYKKSYAYYNGFYEDLERQFRGFERVSVTEHGDLTAPTLVTQHEFFTGGPDGIDNDGDGDTDEISSENYREEDALKGMVRALESRSEAGTLFNRSENTWSVRNLLLNPQGTEVRFAHRTQSDLSIYEGTGTPETIRTTYIHDDYGNLTEQRNLGALSITGDEAFAFSEYINDTNNWLLGFPKRQYLTDASLVKASETFSYYDGADYTGLGLGQVTRGNLTRQQSWVNGSSYVDTVRAAYDSYGNIIGSRDANGFVRSISYDASLHTYPVQESIEVGNGNPDLAVTAAYNLGLGVLTSSLDFNSNETSYGYDTFGRSTTVVQPGDSPALPTQSFVYTAADPDNNLLYEYDPAGVLTLTSGTVSASSVLVRAREVSGQAGTYDVIQYVDGMGRNLATLEEAQTGFSVKEAVIFNARGTPLFSYLPYAAASIDYARPASLIPTHESRYDVMGRNIIVFNPPDSQDVVTSSATQFLPLRTISTDENSNTKEMLSDGLERLIEVREQNQGDTYVTSYSYDTQGNLLQITDAQNNVKSMSFDHLKRRIALDDPDRGHMDYSYDPAGNLISTVDNKGQEVRYTYDGVNRMLSKDYLDANGIAPDITYYYDIPSQEYPGAENTIGSLVQISDLSGGAFFSYDVRGNVPWSVKRITDNGVNHDYVSAARFDAMGRVTRTIYPDGDFVDYQYNAGALLAIPDVVDAISYLPSDQLDEITYANGLTTSYSYDPRNRLSTLITDQTIPTGNPIQSLVYNFDGVSNIAAITDLRSLSADSPKNASQSFGYDELYRLTQASGPGYGSIAFQYDRIGNMTFKTSPTAADPDHINDPLINLGAIANGGTGGTSGRGVKLPGDSPGPHAVTATDSGLVFDYDDNGNMTQHATGDLYQWDFQDRLVRTTAGNVVADYVYDYSGQRVIKRAQSTGSSSVTYYIDDDYEMRDGKPVKYVFDGSRRVARIDGRLTEGRDTSQFLNFHLGWNFFSLEVTPANTAIATVLAPLAGKYSEVWSFDTLTQQYQGYAPTQGITDLTDLQAQRGYIINITTPAIIELSGTPAGSDTALVAGWNLLSTPSNRQLPVVDALASLPPDYEIWKYDIDNSDWRAHLPGQPSFLSDLDTLLPGKAYWIKTTSASQLPYQQQPTSINFYHPDHLGSSNMITDSNGVVIESTEFYPFGRPRHEERTGVESAYKYTGKELDKESGLMYYEARYYEPVVGRFASVDPLAEGVRSEWLGSPQKYNSYSFVQNRPMVLIDPSGLDSEAINGQGEKSFSNVIGKVYLENLSHATKEGNADDLASALNDSFNYLTKLQSGAFSQFESAQKLKAKGGYKEDTKTIMKKMQGLNMDDQEVSQAFIDAQEKALGKLASFSVSDAYKATQVAQHLGVDTPREAVPYVNVLNNRITMINENLRIKEMQLNKKFGETPPDGAMTFPWGKIDTRFKLINGN